MKVEELRIGNWINVTKSPYEKEKGESQISGTGIYYISKNEGDKSDLIVEPIKITKKWLLKLGFKKNNKGEFHILDWDEEEYKVAKLFKDHDLLWFCYNCYDIDRDGIWVPLLHIQYVHQLQNIYQIMTGEELTIKQ